MHFLALLTLGSLAAARKQSSLPDCVDASPGAAVPDENTFQLPLESYRSTRDFQLCSTASANCSTSSLIMVNLREGSFVFTFEPYANLAYSAVQLRANIPAIGTTTERTYAVGSGCTLASGGTSATCYVPYAHLLGTSDKAAQKMCPNGDSAGYELMLAATATMRDAVGQTFSFKNKAECTDYPTCQSTVDYWLWAYRCTKCPAVSSTSTSTSTSTSKCSTSTTSTSTSSTPCTATATVDKYVTRSYYATVTASQYVTQKEWVTRTYCPPDTTCTRHHPKPTSTRKHEHEHEHKHKHDHGHDHDHKGPDGNGPDGKGPDGKGPDGKGPDEKGPDGKGPNGKGPGPKQ